MLPLDIINFCQKKPLRGSPTDNPLVCTLFTCRQWMQNKWKIFSFFSCSIFIAILSGYPYPRFGGKKINWIYGNIRSIIHRIFIWNHCVRTPEAVSHSCHRCLRLPDRFPCSFSSDILTFWNFCSDLWVFWWTSSSCKPWDKTKKQEQRPAVVSEMSPLLQSINA